jgi:hypothetical protein
MQLRLADAAAKHEGTDFAVTAFRTSTTKWEAWRDVDYPLVQFRSYTRDYRVSVITPGVRMLPDKKALNLTRSNYSGNAIRGLSATRLFGDCVSVMLRRVPAA